MPPHPRSATTTTAIAGAGRSVPSAPTRRSRSTTRRSTASAATSRSGRRSSRAGRPARAPGISASWRSRSSAPVTWRCSRTRRSTSAPDPVTVRADRLPDGSRPPGCPAMIAGLLMLAGGVAAGVFGSLLGLGGGVLLVPLLTLGFGLPLREAVGDLARLGHRDLERRPRASTSSATSRTCAWAWSSSCSRLCGALVGGLIAFLLDGGPRGPVRGAPRVRGVHMLRRRTAAAPVPQPPPTSRSRRRRDARARPVPSPPRPRRPRRPSSRASGPGYTVDADAFGVVGAVFAGVVSALLGVGGGIVKVPLMNLAMGVPLKVATATSNMMIGITATSSRRHLPPARRDRPVHRRARRARGVRRRVGRRAGDQPGRHPAACRYLFIAVLIVTAAQMAAKALGL